MKSQLIAAKFIILIKLRNYILILISSVLYSCTSGGQYSEDFDRYNDRIWINEELWPIPIEDWKIENGRVECVGNIADMRLNLLTREVVGDGEFVLSVDMGLINEYDFGNASGVRIGINDHTDNDIRSRCYFGHGINIGVHTDGFLFVDSEKEELPVDFALGNFNLQLEVIDSIIRVTCIDSEGRIKAMESVTGKKITGTVSLVQNFEGLRFNKKKKYPQFFFDNLSLSGTNIVEKEEQAFGPILFSMYTLSNETLKLTTQMPPLGDKDNQQIDLQIKKEGKWETIQSVEMEKDARIAPFRIDDWDSENEHNYRVAYTETFKNSSTKQHYYEGLIRKEPNNSQLSIAGLTCQYASGFPYRPLTENLRKSNPDMLYFSGDQIYEGNGGYDIYRVPGDKAILNYLGKWYMFGWSFSNVMRDRPTITIPDDHEMFQGNLWGEGGESVSLENWNKNLDCISGFVQPMEMVHMVIRTNCSHLPDPYDPKPMKNDIPVYYTDFEYGGVSFAIVGDRIFKSGPENVSKKKGRIDHLKEPIKDPSALDRPGLSFLGQRQMDFLSQWSQTWDGKQIKVLLSQTIFANAATHHGGERMFLAGDLDSGGWPQTSKNQALELMKSCNAFHICGDQHFPSMLQYGIKEFRDAGWVFCTPAISVGYPRRFFPDQLKWDIKNRPSHNLPNTGEYTDGFGNKNYVYAVGNPDDLAKHRNRYKLAELKASGYGMIYLDSEKQQVKCESIRFLGDVDNIDEAQFPGWPVTIDLSKKLVIE